MSWQSCLRQDWRCPRVWLSKDTFKHFDAWRRVKKKKKSLALSWRLVLMHDQASGLAFDFKAYLGAWRSIMASLWLNSKFTLKHDQAYGLSLTERFTLMHVDIRTYHGLRLTFVPGLDLTFRFYLDARSSTVASLWLSYFPWCRMKCNGPTFNVQV